MNSPEPLFPDEAAQADFVAALPTRAIGKSLRYLPRTGSTNDLALQAAREDAPHGLLIVADAQEAGRGRRGRSWVTPAGKALLFSVLARLDGVPSANLGWVSLVAGLSVIEALENIVLLSDVPIALKWPNDVVVLSEQSGTDPRPWRKLGGILCESSLTPDPSKTNRVVIGIGLNVLQSQSELPDLPKVQATSLLQETGTAISRRPVLSGLLQAIERNLDALSDDERFRSLTTEVENRLRSWWQARTLELRTPHGTLSGRFLGLDTFGRVVLDNVEGGESAVADGEIVTVR